jgi:uncharacterized glyoxalase superfamily protein PhnB
MAVKPVPDGFRTVTPYMMSGDPDRLIAFLKDAFQAEVLYLMRQGDGKVLHAQVRIIDSMIMIGGADSHWPAEASSLYLYVEDSDRIFASAVAAGAQVIMPVADQIYGDRMGGVKDPTGNTWWISTHTEEVSEEEMARRFKQRATRGQ